ncbi:MAG: SPASM domain-containing protein [Nanoarchaeota archaeon]
MSFIKRTQVDYIENFYRHKLYCKQTNHYLLTTDTGNFIFLNQPSFRNLKKGFITNQATFDSLESKGFIITLNNINQIIEQTKKRYSFLDNGTSLHIVIPTHRCNLNCVYCFASSCDMNANIEQTDMSIKTAEKITQFIMESPSRAITIEFQGGEPTARFDIIQAIVEKANKLNKTLQKDLRFALVSNFTLLNDKIVDWLIDHNVTFCTSLDGPKYVHDKNRFILNKKFNNINEINKKQVEVIGSYEKVIYWINRINEKYKQKKIPLKVNALLTITKYSLDYYKEIIDEYINLDINIIDLRPLTQIGRALKEKETIFYTRNQFVEFYQKSLDYIDELTQKGIKIEDRIKVLFNSKILLNKPTYHTDYESPCGALTGQIVYHTNGNIYTCNEALGRDELKIGDVFNDTWQNLFKKKEVSKAILNSMLENNSKCDRCVYKPYCGTCMVENFYNLSKFNFYPEKTFKHHEVTFHCERFFDSVLAQIKKKYYK